MTDLRFEPFADRDFDACLALFDRNCPAFFAQCERAAYADFLRGADARYRVCLADGEVAGAFGVFASERGRARLHWILIDPAWQGRRIGRAMMIAAVDIARRDNAAALDIAASHISAPFFARFGARSIAFAKDGWGPGMHRVDMELQLRREET